jgi:hypothetical protein
MLSVNDLPLEILAEIAIFYAHEKFNPPIELLYIFRKWRDIILSAPPCWSCLKIKCNSDPERPSIPIIASWIQKSGVSPLFISLDMEETTDQQVPLLLPSSALVQERDRFRELCVYRASEWNLWNLVHLWPAPNLLSSTITEDEGSSSFKPPLELLEFPLFLRNDPQAPRLSTLHMSHCRFGPPRCELTGVQELSLEYCTSSIKGFRRSLRCMPNLLRMVLGPVGIDLEVTYVTYTLETPSIPEPTDLVLRHIWSMNLHLEDRSIPILDRFITPSLTHLTLVATVTRTSLDAIITFLGQKDLPLKYLSAVLLGAHSPHNIALILPTLPKMETLHLGMRHISFHPLAVKNHPALTGFKIQFEPPPKSIRHWEELFDDQPEYQVSGRLLPNW